MRGTGRNSHRRVRGSEQKARQYETERQRVRIRRETLDLEFSAECEFMSVLRRNMKACSCRREIEMVCKSKRRHRSTHKNTQSTLFL